MDRLPAPLTVRLAAAAAGAWLALLVAAPLLLDPGTVTGLAGHENHLDHLDRWLELPLVPGAVYAVGDLLCHQTASHSLALGGNQLPVDARLTGIFAGALVGLAVAARPRLPRRTFRLGAGLLRAAGLPRARWPGTPTRQAVLALGAVALMQAPAALDVGVQALTGYTSTNATRVATGLVAGLAGGATLGVGLHVLESTLRAALERPASLA